MRPQWLGWVLNPGKIGVAQGKRCDSTLITWVIPPTHLITADTALAAVPFVANSVGTCHRVVEGTSFMPRAHPPSGGGWVVLIKVVKTLITPSHRVLHHPQVIIGNPLSQRSGLMRG